MWYVWTVLALVSCARCGVTAGAGVEPATGSEGLVDSTPIPTTRSPRRTLDRQAAELAWRAWLQSPESRDPHAPPRRITTKSLFITPLVCPKGQRLDRDGCVQIFTLNENEHEKYLLDQLNALFTSAPGNTDYDYGDEEPGPLQLTIPISLDPQASPLLGQEPVQAQDVKPNYIQLNKKEDKPNNPSDVSIEAELELLKLENTRNPGNNKTNNSHKILNNVLLPSSEKPKRDNSNTTTLLESVKNSTDEGQKELVFGNVSIDPILYLTDYQNQQTNTSTAILTEKKGINTTENNKIINETQLIITVSQNKSDANVNNNNTNKELKNDEEKTKLNPENDYSDIGEAIKLISRYAEVTTDDNFTKDTIKNSHNIEDGILGTRTKMQHRRNKPKSTESTPMRYQEELSIQNTNYKHNLQPKKVYANIDNYYRYPWPSEHSPSPPPNYPFRHLQDYWPGRRPAGSIYSSGHENPRRHHHSYTHNNMRPHGYADYGRNSAYTRYPGQHITNPFHRLIQRREPVQPHDTNQDLYSLLGLRHWFSSEGSAKR